LLRLSRNNSEGHTEKRKGQHHRANTFHDLLLSADFPARIAESPLQVWTSSKDIRIFDAITAVANIAQIQMTSHSTPESGACIQRLNTASKDGSPGRPVRAEARTHLCTSIPMLQ
jgi:hypothetical protein